MAQFDTNKQVLNRNNNVLYEVQMQADQYGNIISPGATSRSAFGEPIAVPLTPVVQLDKIYGLDPKQFETYTSQSGSVFDDPRSALMQCSTGTAVGGYGVIRSARAVRYRPGQGAVARFTAKFSPGVAGYTQRAGFFTQEQALQVGYDGEQFGILLQNGGKAHIYSFIIVAGATVTGNITIRLNSVPTVVAVTAGDSIATVARKIADAFAINNDWLVEYSNNRVVFLAKSVGPKAGLFDYADTDGTGVNAIGTTTQTGVAHTDNWIPQQSFNIDTLDGNGPSTVNIDPTKLNIFQINFRWLGAGELRFAIENPLNGDMIFFHHIHYSNQNIDVHIDNPSLKIGYVAASLGGSGTNVVVEGASIMGGIEGVIQNTKLPVAANISYNPSPNLGSLTYHHALTIHNRLVYNFKINTREVLLKNINASFTTASTVPVTVLLFYDFSSLPDLEYATQSEQYSSVYYSTTTGTVTLGNNLPVYIIDVPGGGNSSVDLTDLRIAIPPNHNISALVYASGAISRVALSLTWVED